MTHTLQAVFSAWAPTLHQHYRRLAHYYGPMGLKEYFPGTVWAACTFNLGPRTVTMPHVDWQNLPMGWCSVTALGDYDPDKGGHLVLWDLGIVVRFPPGATALIPSALVHHSNAGIASGEKRYSLAFYCSGGLFRYLDYAGRLGIDFKKEDPEGYKIYRAARDKLTMKDAHKFSLFNDLAAEYAK